MTEHEVIQTIDEIKNEIHQLESTVEKSLESIKNKMKILNGFSKDVKMCKSCGKPFAPKRRDAVVCGGTCRKRLQRELNVIAGGEY